MHDPQAAKRATASGHERESASRVGRQEADRQSPTLERDESHQSRPGKLSCQRVEPFCGEGKIGALKS
jgi:hypothetical protein